MIEKEKEVQEVQVMSVFFEENLDMHMSYAVYEVYTWDDVSYTEVARFLTCEEAEKECERLNKENRARKCDPNPICYAVYSDSQFCSLMR